MQPATPEQARQLEDAYTRLVGSSDDVDGLEDGMGKIYKAMVIAHKDLPVPVAFDNTGGPDSASNGGSASGRPAGA